MGDDLCMFCLNNCSTYINLEYCSCKTITHKECFDTYLQTNYIKCIICRKTYESKSYKKIIEKIIENHSFINSLFYSIFFMLQNIYFYIDNKCFSNSDGIYGIFRALFAVIFHACLLSVTFFPYILTVHIKYVFILINSINIFNKKVYKLYNL